MREEPIIFCFGDVEYDIYTVTFGYTEDFDFLISAELKLPDEIFPPVLTVSFVYNDAQKNVEKHNPEMAEYVMMKMEDYCNTFDGYHDLTFKALEEEGFDLKQYMRHALSELELKINKQVDPSLN